MTRLRDTIAEIKDALFCLAMGDQLFMIVTGCDWLDDRINWFLGWR